MTIGGIPVIAIFVVIGVVLAVIALLNTGNLLPAFAAFVGTVVVGFIIIWLIGLAPSGNIGGNNGGQAIGAPANPGGGATAAPQVPPKAPNSLPGNPPATNQSWCPTSPTDAANKYGGIAADWGYNGVDPNYGVQWKFSTSDGKLKDLKDPSSGFWHFWKVPGDQPVKRPIDQAGEATYNCGK